MALEPGGTGNFAPAFLLGALALYRRDFESSATLDRAHATVGVNICAADTDDEARRVEWGAEGQPYRGWMQVEPEGDGSRLTLHVTSERLTKEHLGELKGYAASTIESLRKLF